MCYFFSILKKKTILTKIWDFMMSQILCLFWVGFLNSFEERLFLTLDMILLPEKTKEWYLKNSFIISNTSYTPGQKYRGNRVLNSSLISLLLSVITKWCVESREGVAHALFTYRNWTSAFARSQGRVHKRRHEGLHWRM